MIPSDIPSDKTRKVIMATMAIVCYVHFRLSLKTISSGKFIFIFLYFHNVLSLTKCVFGLKPPIYGHWAEKIDVSCFIHHDEHKISTSLWYCISSIDIHEFLCSLKNHLHWCMTVFLIPLQRADGALKSYQMEIVFYLEFPCSC